MPANFRLGMDGYFYGATGDKGLFKARGRTAGSLHAGRESSDPSRRHPDSNLSAMASGTSSTWRTGEDGGSPTTTRMSTSGCPRLYPLRWTADLRLAHHFIPRRDYTLWCLAPDYGGGAASLGHSIMTAVPGPALEAQRTCRTSASAKSRAWPRGTGRRHLPGSQSGGSVPQSAADFRPVGICLTRGRHWTAHLRLAASRHEGPEKVSPVAPGPGRCEGSSRDARHGGWPRRRRPSPPRTPN